MSVSTVATNRPPIIVIAIGPQKMLPASGIMPRMAAIAVSNTGRVRRHHVEFFDNTRQRTRPSVASTSFALMPSAQFQPLPLFRRDREGYWAPANLMRQPWTFDGDI
jgi:hypothetical protein